MTPTREILEAALEGFDIQKRAIEAKQAEIREALKSPVEVMAQAAGGVIAALQNYDPSQTGNLSRIEKQMRIGWKSVTNDDLDEIRQRNLERDSPLKKKRKMSAAGRASISKATKARWAKYRKEQKRA